MRSLHKTVPVYQWHSVLASLSDSREFMSPSPVASTSPLAQTIVCQPRLVMNERRDVDLSEMSMIASIARAYAPSHVKQLR